MQIDYLSGERIWTNIERCYGIERQIENSDFKWKDKEKAGTKK